MITLFTGLANKITPVRKGFERPLTAEELRASNRVMDAFNPRAYKQRSSVAFQKEMLHTDLDIDDFDNKIAFAVSALTVLRMRKKSEAIEQTADLLDDPLAATRLRHIGQSAIRIRAACMVPVLAVIGINTMPEDRPDHQQVSESSIQGSLQSSMSGN